MVLKTTIYCIMTGDIWNYNDTYSFIGNQSVLVCCVRGIAVNGNDFEHL